MIRVRSCYSIKKSLIDLNKYLKWIKNNQIKNAILVDTSMSAFIAFYNLCCKQNIKPIFGFEKEDEYIVFPTTTASLETFYKVINHDESDFSSLIVYKLNTNIEFCNAHSVNKIFDHDVYNSLNNTEFFKECGLKDLKVLTKLDYHIDENLILATNYKIKPQNYLFQFENAHKMLVAKINKNLKEKNIVLTIAEQKRLNYELQIIKNKDFSSYFLIYAQIITYLNQKKILYGFGRGSASSSFVCYLLNITKINPLKYGLLFERFLSENRNNYPDIDLDIDATYRDELVQVLMKKYSSSCQISTYVRLGIKKAQDIVNVKYKLPQLILKKLRDSQEVEQLIRTDSTLVNFIKDVNIIKNLIINKSVHPAGIIIANCDIQKYLPVENNICAYEYKELEWMGYVKFDLLKLNTLSLIQNTVKTIKKNHLKIKPFSLEDKNLFNLVNEMQTKYVFQLDSMLARNIIKKFKIDSFDDLAILISLNRPGTMHLLEKIVEAKNKKIKTNSTYGVIIFQEQIMSLLVSKYNLSSNQANNIRIAISKKDVEKMNQIRKYIISQKQDPKWLDEVSKASEYAFNKAHAYAYARLVMQILYYKYYYVNEFLLNFTKDNLTLEDIIYLKYRKSNINAFGLTNNTQIKNNILKLGLKYLKIDPSIKNYIIEQKCNDFMQIRHKFDNKINDQDIKNLISSQIFKNKYQTSDKYELEYNKIPSLLRVRQWLREENKEKWMFNEQQINFLQTQVMGFSFNNIFSENNIIKIEFIQKLPKMIKGTLICNYGRLEFVYFQQTPLKENMYYKVKLVPSFYKGDMNVIISDIKIITWKY